MEKLEKFEIKNEKLVSIKIPEIAVTEENSTYYLQLVNKFMSDLRNTFINDIGIGEDIFEMDTLFDGELIPVATKIKSLAYIFDKFVPEIQEFEKYVIKDRRESAYLFRDEISQIWKSSQGIENQENLSEEE